MAVAVDTEDSSHWQQESSRPTKNAFSLFESTHSLKYGFDEDAYVGEGVDSHEMLMPMPLMLLTKLITMHVTAWDFSVFTNTTIVIYMSSLLPRDSSITMLFLLLHPYPKRANAHILFLEDVKTPTFSGAQQACQKYKSLCVRIWHPLLLSALIRLDLHVWIGNGHHFLWLFPISEIFTIWLHRSLYRWIHRSINLLFQRSLNLLML